MPEYVIEREVPGAGDLTEDEVGLPANRISAVRRLLNPEKFQTPAPNTNSKT